MTVDELAAAIRAYVGRPRTPDNPDSDTWYIDIDSMASDGEILALAIGIVRAGQDAAATPTADQTDTPRTP